MAIIIPKDVNISDRDTVEAFLSILQTKNPSLEQIWFSMDYVWDILGCSSKELSSEKVDAFYSHPIWLLNGLFIEQHRESLKHREIFSHWVESKNPSRVADFGGGYGTLGRMIAEKLPNSEIHLIEPFPHSLAVEITNKYSNLHYKKSLEGEYDIIIATDVFEHVPDPLLLVENSSSYLREGGYYLIANCFFPVIKCHLPSTFHFRYSWKLCLSLMELKHQESLSYGDIFLKKGEVSAKKARKLEKISKILFPMFEIYRKSKRRILGR
jgi:hypothetical protein